MKKIYFLGILLILSVQTIKSQESSLYGHIETIGGYISPGHVPFWLRSNQFGSIPLDNASLSILGTFRKDYDFKKHRVFDWGAAIGGRANIGNKSNFTLIEGYAKVRLSIFELKAGRCKEITGLCDTSLSCGSFAVSGNALGIPKIQLGIPDFYILPFCGKLFAFKGSFVHGWIGKIPIVKLDNSKATLNTYMHQSSLYGRFGKPAWKWKLFGGFNHQVYWGSEPQYYGSDYTLTNVECFLYVITGRTYGTNAIQRSKIGNHLGSIDVGLEYEFKNTRLLAYHQFFYDIGALYYLANVRDGLNGLSLTNIRYHRDHSFHWKKALLEVLYSKNQAGEFWSPYTPSGDENYYNNDQYINGWSFKGMGNGNPFLCTRLDTRQGLPANPIDYFFNNRVVAFHFGLDGSVQNWDFLLKTSFSLNYGTFGTSEVGHTVGKVRTLPLYGIFTETKQLSTYLKAGRELKNRLNLGLIMAFDTGDLYYNCFGLQLSCSKSF